MMDWLKVLAICVAIVLLTMRGCSFGLENSQADKAKYTSERY